ncbi:hypothetical protein K5I29_01725 [Flavobacterium agricola]|uniref:Beta-carotene 15,15'-monooxygenase n=1 Tax=Flavobacterium agricola TaxID=2870839 RepID=A0ABY6M390_9FLAO|nr:hypothetical protein [Flavobacterium agricola]UYW01671.1 hypothetical protein K5I29_01725 [Flavobacterium agricola]
MDELDLLKNSWKQSQNNYPKYNDDELYKMLHKKSTSIVKWILIISIIELIIITSLDVFINNTPENDAILLKYHVYHLLKGVTYLHYCIIIGFVYTFYINFKKINVSDNLKKLMANILFVKKITNYYIIYNLSVMAITAIIYSIAAMLYDPTIQQMGSTKNKLVLYLGFGFGLAVSFSLLIALFYFIYKLIYGRLIKKLTRNYEELKKLDL